MGGREKNFIDSLDERLDSDHNNSNDDNDAVLELFKQVLGNGMVAMKKTNFSPINKVKAFSSFSHPKNFLRTINYKILYFILLICEKSKTFFGFKLWTPLNHVI